MAFSVNNNTNNVTIQVTQPYLVVDDEGLKAFAVGIQGPPTGATTNLAGLTDVDDAAVPMNRYFAVGDGTKFVTRGILGDDLPTGIDAAKLANGLVSNTEFQYLNGVSSSIQTQIDGKAATSHVHSGADITSGTLPVARLNGGNSTQFVRGDGTYSNTLTGGLTIAGALAGATTGSFSTSVTTPILNPSVVGGSVIVGGNLAWSASWVTETSRNSIAQTTGGLLVINTPSANQLYIRQAGVDKVLLGDMLACYGTGGMAFVGANTTQFTTQAPSIGSRNAVNLNLNARGSVVLENGGTASLTAASAAVTLGSHCKIIYGAAGTTTAANNEIVGTSTGLNANVASGGTFSVRVAGTARMNVNATSISLASSLILQPSGYVPATSAGGGSVGQIAFDSSGNFYLCYAINTWLKFTGVTF